MKIQHWAIVFIIIILPFSIVARSTINKKADLLKEETRYNNIVDNATYDAVSQIIEVSELDGVGKNVPITKRVADAALDRFFNTLAVNFNLPVIKHSTDSNKSSARAYFSQYVPAVIIVGYDGLYVYSYEQSASGYDYVLKPKIPYAYDIDLNSLKITVNFTLDNKVKVYIPDPNFTFSVGYPDADGYQGGTHYIEGYVGNFLDYNNDGINDWQDKIEPNGFGLLEILPDESNSYLDNDDPFYIKKAGNPYRIDDAGTAEKLAYILKEIPTKTDNLSYILFELVKNSTGTQRKAIKALFEKFGYDLNSVPLDEPEKIDFTVINQDYEYDDEGNIIKPASLFHLMRREAIISTIQSVIKQEFNEHNNIARNMGITYDFSIPSIGRDQWNNTIDDVSVLAFIQGIPMGYDTYYNNYSLGGARIIKRQNLYAERASDSKYGAGVHKVYHKYYCPLIPRDSYGFIKYTDSLSGPLSQLEGPIGAIYSTRRTSGIENIFINEEDAHEAGYYACSECM